MLYKIIKINSEHLAPVIKRKILLKCREYANTVVRNEKLSGIDADERFDSEFRESTPMLTRYVVATLRSREIDLYKNNTSTYTLKSKS